MLRDIMQLMFKFVNLSTAARKETRKEEGGKKRKKEMGRRKEKKEGKKLRCLFPNDTATYRESQAENRDLFHLEL